jgi:hypothetical protein
VLEHRQELPRWQQRLLFLAHAHQHLRHRVALLPREREDRLAEKRELVLVDRLAQPAAGLGKARELGVRLVDVVVHAGIVATAC